VTAFDPPDSDGTDLRRAGKELLSLALIEARNHTLRWAAALEASDGGRALVLDGAPAEALAELDPPLWTFGHIAWFQEFWCLRYSPDDPAGMAHSHQQRLWRGASRSPI